MYACELSQHYKHMSAQNWLGIFFLFLDDDESKLRYSENKYLAP